MRKPSVSLMHLMRSPSRDFVIERSLLPCCIMDCAVPELCSLKVKDIQERRGVLHIKVHGKGSKIRHLPLHPEAQTRISDYLDVGGHFEDRNGALFRPVRNNSTGTLEKSLSTNSVYELVRSYGLKVGIKVEAFSTHSLRATACTNALENDAPIARVQDWMRVMRTSRPRECIITLERILRSPPLTR